MRLLKEILVGLMLTAPVGAVAQDYDRGLAAAQAGDFTAALAEWVPLAENGDEESQVILGSIYYFGKGVPQDNAESLKWFSLAAKQGNPTAQTLLGTIYATGKGVLQDTIRGHMWFNIAAANGEADGAELRDSLSELMTLTDLSEAQRRARTCMETNYQECD